MHSPYIERVKKLIAKDNLEEVVEELLKNEQWLSESTREEILSLSGRLQQVRQQERKGTISHEYAQLEWNRIREALIQMVEFYSKSPEERAKAVLQKKIKLWIPLILYLIAMTSLLWWLFQPQQSFKMQADLLVERLSFRYLEGPANFARGRLESCFIQNFESIELEGDRIIWDKISKDNWAGSKDLNSKIMLTADENIPGIGIHFGPSQLEKLVPASAALLTFSQFEEDPSLIKMTVQQDEGLRSEWNFQDSMDLEGEMIALNGIDGTPTFYAPTQMRIFPGTGRAREMKIINFPGTSHFDLQFYSNFELKGKNLLISSPSFYQPLEAVAVPTLLAGQIQIGIMDQKPLKIIDISEGEALDIFAEAPYSLQDISFTEEGIAIKFYGTVQKIETGRNHENRNPSRIEWLWYSRKWLVLAITVVSLGFIIVLLSSLRKTKNF